MRKTLLAIGFAALMLMSATFTFAAEDPAPAPSADTLYKIDITDAPYIGPIDAPITIIEFIDYQ